MNISVSMKALVTASFALLATAGLEQRALAAEDTYRVRELRDITNKPGVGLVRVWRLNNMSEMVGESTDAAGAVRPTFWHHFFPTNLYAAYNQQIFSATGLNDRSEIAGSGLALDGRSASLILLRKGKLERARQQDGFEFSAGGARMNNRGEVASSWQGGDMSSDAQYWFNGYFNQVPGNDDMNTAAAINNAGVICGSSGYDTRVGPTNPPAAWLSRVQTPRPLALIPPLPGDTEVQCVDINDHNEVVGISRDGVGGARAYLWRDGVSSDLNLTVAGDAGSIVAAINDSTVIVGSSYGTTEKALIWHDGTARDLTAQIDASDPLKRYVKLTQSVDINEIGEIVAYGTDTRTGRFGAYFLRPMRVLNINP